MRIISGRVSGESCFKCCIFQPLVHSPCFLFIVCEQTALSVGRLCPAPRRGRPPGSTASFINQGHCTTRYTRLSNLAARLKHNSAGLAVERGDRDVGVQSGEDGVGGGTFLSFFFFSYCGGDAGVALRGLHRRAGDLSRSSSPTFRTESQYGKLTLAGKIKKKKTSAGYPYEKKNKLGLSNRIVRKR